MTREIISREEAKECGLKRYFTGEPCKNGHVCERYISKEQCIECLRESQRRAARDPKKLARRNELQRDRRLKSSITNLTPRKIALRVAAEARAMGKKKYFTGLPCKSGHICERNIRGGQCLECEQERHKRRRGSHHYKTYHKAYRSTKKERKRIRSYNRERYYNGPKNPKGEVSWLRKNQAALRNLRRLIRKPNLDHSLWLNEGRSR